MMFPHVRETLLFKKEVGCLTGAANIGRDADTIAGMVGELSGALVVLSML